MLYLYVSRDKSAYRLSIISRTRCKKSSCRSQEAVHNHAVALRAISSARRSALFPHSGPTLSGALQVHLRLPTARGDTVHVGDRYARPNRIDRVTCTTERSRRENEKFSVNYKYCTRSYGWSIKLDVR